MYWHSESLERYLLTLDSMQDPGLHRRILHVPTQHSGRLPTGLCYLSILLV